MTKIEQYKKLKSLDESESGRMAKAVMTSEKPLLMKSFSHYRNNLAWITNRRETLRRKYGDEFVAVFNNKVCIHEKDLPTLLRRVKDKYGESAEVVIDYVGKKRVNLLL